MRNRRAEVEGGRDSIVADAKHFVSHSIDDTTVENLGQMVWDGWNAISDAALGISSQGSRMRNSVRGAAGADVIEAVKYGDGPTRTRIATQTGVTILGSELLGGAALAAGARGIEALRVGARGVRPLKGVEVKTPESPELNNAEIRRAQITQENRARSQMLMNIFKIMSRFM